MRKAFVNGKIYTENPNMPWADSMIIDGKIIAAVGDNLDIEDCEVVDLEGRTVIPGLIDGHTHPSTVAKTYWHVRIPPKEDEDELLEEIRKAAEEYPKEKTPYLYIENYFTETFGEEGPRKEVLDQVVNDRPARIQDFSDHACWYNSIALDMLRDENGIPRAPGPIGEPEFRKDSNGNYTGNCLEAAPDCDMGVYKAIDWYPPEAATEESIGPLFNTLKSKGIMCLMDGYTESEEDIRFYYALDKAGKLEMYYEGASILAEIEDLDETIERLRHWQEAYTTEHIHCNVVKYFIDGVNDHGDCLSTEPFHNDPTGTNYGMAYCSMEEISDVMVRLNEEGIDLHIHTVCDGSFRRVCDAAERAEAICGDEWKIRVTMAHCELIHPDDLPRAAALGLFIDSTPHWSGGYSDEVVIEYHGLERWSTMFDFTRAIAAGIPVGFSSDLYNYNEVGRANPYIGMQIAMTRVDPDFPLDPERFPGSVHPPYDGMLTLEQLIHGYTVVNATRMRLDHLMGSIEEGKLANFVIFEDDIFNYPKESFGEICVYKCYFEGKERS